MLSLLHSLCWNHSDSASFRPALPPGTFGCNHGSESSWKCLTQAGHCSFPFPFPLTEAQALSICPLENSQMVSDSDYSPTLGDIFSIHLNNPSRTCCCELTCCVVSLPNRSFSLIKEKSYIFVHKHLPVVFGVPPIKLETPGNNSLPSGRRCLCGLPHSQFVRTTLFYFIMMILLNFFGLSTESKIFLWSSSDFFLLGNSGKTQAGATEGY